MLEKLCEKIFDRRNAIKLLSILGGFGIAIPFLAPVLANEDTEPPHGEAQNEAADKPKWGMAIDLDKCTGCGGCVVACGVENNFLVPLAESSKKDGSEIYWMTLIKDKEKILPTPCMHCEEPACVKVCPVGATYKSEEGIVVQVYDRCIGCRYCMQACPYSRRYFNWSQTEWVDSYKNQLNPDVSTRPAGVVEKCTFCSHRLRKVQEQAKLNDEPVEDASLQKLTACAEACPVDAITFGNLNDPASLVSKLSRHPRAYTLLEYIGTHPKVFYLAKDRRQD